MKTSWMAAAAVVSLAVGTAAAQQPAPAPTVQQQFEAATAALEAENWAEALRILETLERRVAGTNPRSLAIVRVRKGQALLRLGRLDEAAATIGPNLAALPATDPSLADDRFRSYLTLGRVSELRLQYREAADHYRAALAIEVTPGLKLAVYRGFIQTLMFYDAPAALAAADESLLVLAQAAPESRELEGQFRTLRGRVLLNMGRYAEARAELERATRRLGGLGNMVNLRDIVARSDLSIAALLAGQDDDARRFLALTGAGRIRNAAIPLSDRMPLPRCGDGLSPGDVAVVELSIRDDGTVAAASPVYASVQGDAAVRFARATLGWSWLPEQIRTMQPLFRIASRVELRCTHAASVAKEVPLFERDAVARWSGAQSVPLEFPPALSSSIEEARAELAAAAARSGPASPQLLRPLMRLGIRDDLTARERLDLLLRALRIARAAHAPSPYIAFIARTIAETQHEAANRGREAQIDYVALLADPALASDAYVAASLYLAAFDRHFMFRRNDEAAAMLARVAALPGFGPDHPLRARFVDRTVALAMARGDGEAAAAAWRTLPAGASTCEVPPQWQGNGLGSNGDFPNEAMVWGFEGWAQTELQVGADSRPAPARTTAAYPPFVFGRASERIVGRFRFAPAFAPGGLTCATYSQRVRYQLPDR